MSTFEIMMKRDEDEDKEEKGGGGGEYVPKDVSLTFNFLLSFFLF